MNIYAIRDRLLNYYQQPFAAPQDTAVLAALSRAISNGGDDVIAQAPHHFEIWRLGKVEETGHITGRPEFLADLSSLIRAGRQPTGRGPSPIPPASYREAEETRQTQKTTNADKHPAPDTAQAETGQGEAGHQSPGPTPEPEPYDN